MLTPFCTGFVDLQSPAGIVNSVLVYNYDGYVYASDESRMLAEYKDYTFRLGSVNDQYEDIVCSPKVREISKVWNNETLAGCADCPVRVFCGADPVRNHSTQGDMYGYRPTSWLCKKNKAVIEYLLELIVSMPEIVMPIFKRWIS
jgi:radical SAM protein with 4Fe4S-binding SPASM domain